MIDDLIFLLIGITVFVAMLLVGGAIGEFLDRLEKGREQRNFNVDVKDRHQRVNPSAAKQRGRH